MTIIDRVMKTAQNITEAFCALANQFEVRLSAAQQQVDALTPSLLACAFKGEL
ncbi:MAG: hypothetical protein ABSC01_11525 [Verrucomicrobiota bacterium]